ncbi:MAG TPA: DUF5985 family protein [Polyangiaceae bacterium]|nr:DUF5985 family protein [Polyangiaceae bacterium]
MAAIAYGLGVCTSIFCAFLLIRSYLATRTPLLLWCSFCFVWLALNNVILFVDIFVVPDVNLEIWRNATALIALVLMLVGLIWEEQ